MVATYAVVGSSGGGTSAEEVNLLNPAAGTYTVFVDGYATANPNLHPVHLGAGYSAGNMTVTAPRCDPWRTGAINLTFSGLTAGTKYLGSVSTVARRHAQPDHRPGGSVKQPFGKLQQRNRGLRAAVFFRGEESTRHHRAQLPAAAPLTDQLRYSTPAMRGTIVAYDSPIRCCRR